uniref:Uncharacterized protein n=1 Tax=Kalanchoe fedtschenkoi TaxID=63787 RepID=A0A7N0TYA4_KALFE
MAPASGASPRSPEVPPALALLSATETLPPRTEVTIARASADSPVVVTADPLPQAQADCPVPAADSVLPPCSPVEPTPPAATVVPPTRAPSDTPAMPAPAVLPAELSPADTAAASLERVQAARPVQHPSPVLPALLPADPLLLWVEPLPGPLCRLALELPWPPASLKALSLKSSASHLCRATLSSTFPSASRLPEMESGSRSPGHASRPSQDRSRCPRPTSGAPGRTPVADHADAEDPGGNPFEILAGSPEDLEDLMAETAPVSSNSKAPRPSPSKGPSHSKSPPPSKGPSPTKGMTAEDPPPELGHACAITSAPDDWTTINKVKPKSAKKKKIIKAHGLASSREQRSLWQGPRPLPLPQRQTPQQTFCSCPNW